MQCPKCNIDLTGCNGPPYCHVCGWQKEKTKEVYNPSVKVEEGVKGFVRRIEPPYYFNAPRDIIEAAIKIAKYAKRAGWSQGWEFMGIADRNRKPIEFHQEYSGIWPSEESKLKKPRVGDKVFNSFDGTSSRIVFVEEHQDEKTFVRLRDGRTCVLPSDKWCI